jgi:predicted Zn finger-like uncharacterized protein
MVVMCSAVTKWPPCQTVFYRMNVQCEICGSKYKIEAVKLKKEKTRLKCKTCGNTFIVTKPIETPDTKPRKPMVTDPPATHSRITTPLNKDPLIQKPRYKKIIITSTLILLISLVLCVLTANHNFKNILTDFAKDELMRNVKIKSELISQYYDQKTRLAMAISDSVKVVRAAKEHAVGFRGPNPTNAPISGKMREVTRLKVQNYLSGIYNHWSDELENLFIGDIYGYIMADGLEGTSIGTPLNQDPESDLGWKKALDGKIVVEDFRLSRIPEHKAALISTIYVPMKDNGGIFGSVGISVNFTSIAKSISENHTGIRGYTVLMDRFGRILAHPENKSRLKKNFGDLTGKGWQDLSLMMMDRQSGFGTFFLNGTNYHVYFDQVTPVGKHPDMGLSIASIIGEDEIYQKVNMMHKHIGLMIGIALILSTLILLIIARSKGAQ